MRATFITTALDNGASLEDVQSAAGHADPSTTKLYDRRGYNPEKSASFGFDHGVGHSLPLLYDAKTSHGENIINFNGLGYDPSAGLYGSILDHNKIYH